MARIMITLEQHEREVLIALAQRERRDPRDQAALFIHDGLQRIGLLPADTPTPIAARAAEAPAPAAWLLAECHRDLPCPLCRLPKVAILAQDL